MRERHARLRAEAKVHELEAQLMDLQKNFDTKVSEKVDVFHLVSYTFIVYF